MPNGTRIAGLYPEFYFHVDVSRFPVGFAEDELCKALCKLVKDAIQKYYPNVHVKAHILLEEGSLKGWIQIGKKTILGILGACASIVGVIETTEYALKYVPPALTWIRSHIPQVLEPYHLRDTIRTERRKGAVVRLDELINAFQNRDISFDAYMAEAKAVLEKIAQSEDREELIPTLRNYLDIRYGRDFRWSELEQIVDSAPPFDLPVLPKPQIPFGDVQSGRRRIRKEWTCP